MRERGALPKEEGDAVRECKAMHEENFLSSWLKGRGERKKNGRRKLVLRMKKKGEQRGKEKSRKKRTKR